MAQFVLGQTVNHYFCLQSTLLLIFICPWLWKLKYFLGNWCERDTSNGLNFFSSWQMKIYCTRMALTWATWAQAQVYSFSVQKLSEEWLYYSKQLSTLSMEQLYILLSDVFITFLNTSSLYRNVIQIYKYFEDTHIPAQIRLWYCQHCPLDSSHFYEQKDAKITLYPEWVWSFHLRAVISTMTTVWHLIKNWTYRLYSSSKDHNLPFAEFWLLMISNEKKSNHQNESSHLNILFFCVAVWCSGWKQFAVHICHLITRTANDEFNGYLKFAWLTCWLLVTHVCVVLLSLSC